MVITSVYYNTIINKFLLIIVVTDKYDNEKKYNLRSLFFDYKNLSEFICTFNNARLIIAHSIRLK